MWKLREVQNTSQCLLACSPGDRIWDLCSCLETGSHWVTNLPKWGSTWQPYSLRLPEFWDHRPATPHSTVILKCNVSSQATTKEGAQKDMLASHSRASTALCGNSCLHSCAAHGSGAVERHRLLSGEHSPPESFYTQVSVPPTQRGAHMELAGPGKHFLMSLFLWKHVLILLIMDFWDRVSLCILGLNSLGSPGWPWIHMILLPQLLKCWDYRPLLTCLAMCFYFNLMSFYIFYSIDVTCYTIFDFIVGIFGKIISGFNLFKYQRVSPSWTWVKDS